MWKIQNDINKKVLDCFKNGLIEPLFRDIICYKRNKGKYCTFIKYISSSPSINDERKSLYLTVLKRSKDKVTLSEHIEMFSTHSLSYIKKQYKLYTIQNQKLNEKKYNVKQYSIDPTLKIINVNFFYEKFFVDPKIWNGINSTHKDFSRIKFHINFCEENNLSVCPYCDIDTLHNIGNREIEHFLPKSEYPFLAMHPNNLISSCDSCNKYEGKKTEYYIPIVSPYNYQIGDLIKFKVNDIQEMVEIEKEKIIELDNYITLLNLYERYKNKEVYKTVEGRAKSLFKIFHDNEINGSEITSITFQSYLNYRREPMTFVLKSVYENMKEYSQYKIAIKKS